MPWTARVLPESPIVETCYIGALAAPELADAIAETTELAKQSGTLLLLGDCTELAGGHSLADLFFFVESVTADGGLAGVREAILLPELPESTEMVRFWETACLNRGFSVRVFDDRQAALEWLLE